MIGVAVTSQDLAVAEEFFELFKTPWEQVVPGRRYRVVLATDGSLRNLDADVILAYGSREQETDREAGAPTVCINDPVILEWKQGTFPVYRGVRVFDAYDQEGILKLQGKLVDCRSHREGRAIWRIGYHLFAEIRHLLTKGQPAAYALMPTVEMHIEVLRNLLIESEIPFVEIPPRPAGFDFICCLTHDVDFYGIRRHVFDRTMAGFLYRCSVGSLVDLIRWRRSFAEVIKNWLAFLSLPFVLVGILPDFWRPFDDYAKVEDRRRSTFFLVPFKSKPGVAPDGTLNAWRATPYGIGDIEEDVKVAASYGSELGVHGIDAWRDVDAGHEELRKLASLTGQKATGIRMHWLYFDEDSPRLLEDAGFDYDSTCGYNEAIGYCAGTSQVFRPLGCKALVELPISIMDSALFSPGRMGLARTDAIELCNRIVAYVKQFGGTLVINWHERSLAPERLWGRAYEELIRGVQGEGRAWFATAGEAVEWFRWRRSISFEEHGPRERTIVRVSATRPFSPGAIIRIYPARLKERDEADIVFSGALPIEI